MSKNGSAGVVKNWWDELERLTRILGRVGPDEVCCEGLSQRQCAILRTLVAQEGARLSDLAQSSCITPSAMTRVLEKLEARGSSSAFVALTTMAVPRWSASPPAGRRTRKQLDALMRERTNQIILRFPENSATTS